MKKKLLITIIVFCISFTNLAAQKVGTKVKLVAKDGTTYTGVIQEIVHTAYKVKYDGHDFTAWLTADQFSIIDGTAPAPVMQNAPTDNTNKLKPGDRVECDKAGINSWEKGTIMPYLENDFKDGKSFRVRLDVQAQGGMYLEGIIIPVARIRSSNAAPWMPEKTTVAVGKATVDGDNTLSADRAIILCPVQQSAVTNGAKPNAELCKKIIQCKKGEKAASKGFDGAVTIDVTSLQIGSPRKWDFLRDLGSGNAATIVYPVKATFTYKTFYRAKTEVSENWIRILNFYVDAFGEWAIGSEESIKAGETKNIPRE